MEIKDFLDSNSEFLQVKKTYEGYEEDVQLLNEILPTKPELASFKISYENFFIRKFIIVCANSFELHLVRNLSETLCKDKTLLSNFIKKQALERKYHQLFSWERNNANSFFALFGEEFKTTISEKIKINDDLEQGQGAFLLLGRTRNQIVHQGFDYVKIEFDVENTWNYFLQAINFYEFTWEFIKEKSNIS